MLGETTTDWRTKRREVTREAILAAAWDVVHEHGLAALTLREVAARVGMRAPSLYSHFAAKDAIHDAMFAQAWAGMAERLDELDAVLPTAPRAALRAAARTFVEYAVADPERNQLMNLRALPGFEPGQEAYAWSVQVYERMRARFARIGITEQADLDLYTALVSGIVNQQLANDPGGERWTRLLDRAMDMLADELGLPDEPERPEEDR